eukprot:491431_1
MYEPPSVCDTIPYQHVAEWYFESVRKCIIPRKGFGDGSSDRNLNRQADPCNTTINSQSEASGKLMTFSFNVESKEEIKCYLYWNGQTQRFLPMDIQQLLPLLFVDVVGREKAIDKTRAIDTITNNRDNAISTAKSIKSGDDITAHTAYMKMINIAKIMYRNELKLIQNEYDKIQTEIKIKTQKKLKAIATITNNRNKAIRAAESIKSGDDRSTAKSIKSGDDITAHTAYMKMINIAKTMYRNELKIIQYEYDQSTSKIETEFNKIEIDNANDSHQNDEPSIDDRIRNAWKIGSKCQVYSISKSKWCSAEVN